MFLCLGGVDGVDRLSGNEQLEHSTKRLFKVAQKQDTHPGLARPEIMCVKRCCESEERGKAC